MRISEKRSEAVRRVIYNRIFMARLMTGKKDCTPADRDFHWAQEVDKIHYEVMLVLSGGSK